MQIEVREIPVLREELHVGRLSSGLTVFVLPRPGFHKKYASFATHYGSVDNCFVPPGGRRVCVPDGIAHFLEHTLFEKENGNASDWFSELGASSNAYTSYLLTTYLFSCTDRFEACLDILLNFVLEPYFSPANIEKERGIIEQELLMYDDMPDRRVILALLEALYHEHPVRVDIGGTVQSIREVTAELLTACYDTFYHPENMSLVVLGDVEPVRVIEQVAENVDRRGFAKRGAIERIFPAEPPQVRERRVEIEMTASRPRLALGFKELPEAAPGRGQLRERLLMGLVLRSLFGRSSPLYSALYEDGLIDDSFYSYYESSPTYGHTLVGGETDDPDKLLDRLQSGIAEHVDRGIDADEFERLRRAYLGRFLDNFNSLEQVAASFLSHHVRGSWLFDTFELVESLTVEEANDRLQRHFASENFSVENLKNKN